MKLNKIASAVALAVACTGAACAAATPDTVKVKIISINDFHGQLESPGLFRALPTDTAGSIPVGGIDFLAGYFAQVRSQNPNTAIVSVGDMIGASPLVSALFHDEPTIEAMNLAGLELNAVGNHEFGDGRAELLRMQNGGCHPTSANSCQGASVGTPVPFEGARFQFLAANVIDRASGQTIFPAFAIKEYEGVKVGFIGLTLRDTPTVVTPTGVVGLRFTDEARTINRVARMLQARGVRAIVALLHQGGSVPTTQSAATVNGCEGELQGSRVRDTIAKLSPAVDVVLTADTHQAYNCRLPNRAGRLVPVTQANSHGRVATEVDMELNRRNGAVLSVNTNNVVIDQRSITPDPRLRQLLDGYSELSAPLRNRVIGQITATLSRTPNAAREQVMGNIIADAQLAATSSPRLGGAQIAFMNPGGVRADMTFASSPAGEGDGNVTYGEAFTVQPFNNNLVVMTLTGAQIEALLEQQFTGCVNDRGQSQPFNRVLLPSAGFSYSWSATGPNCDKVDPASIMLNGVPVDPAANYRVTVNSFLAAGGDTFSVLTRGTNRVGGVQDLDALAEFFRLNSPVAPVPLNRITLLP